MNYSNDNRSCRVDFFKEGGKWYTTETIVFDDWEGELFSEFRKALYCQIGNRLTGMWAVCLEPYSKHSHPIMIKWEGKVPDAS